MDDKHRPEAVIALDSHSLLFRAFYAMPYLSLRDGTPTNAAYGFTRMLLLLLESEQPDFVIAAFDAPGPTFRHEAFVKYKAHRERAPDDLRAQFPLVRDILACLGVQQMELQGYEADDLLGAISCRAERTGYRCTLVTGDRDLLQLATDRTEILLTQRGVSQTTRLDAEGVLSRLGLSPHLIPDLKALAGDASDNIPGVPGIGDKTAARLLTEYNSLENLLARAESLSSERQRAALRGTEEQVRLSKQLATIRKDLPLDLDWELCRWRWPDSIALRGLFERYEFSSLVQQYAKMGTEPSQESEQRDGPEALDTVCHLARELGRVAVLSCNSENGKLSGFSVAARRDLTAFVPLAPPPTAAGVELSLPGLREAGSEIGAAPDQLCALLSDASVAKTVCDAKSLRRQLLSVGCDLVGVQHDVLLMDYLLDPSSQTRSLSGLARLHLLPGEHEGSAGESAALLLPLADRLDERLTKQGQLGLYKEIELPLVEVLFEMEEQGMLLDVPYLQDLSSRLAAQASALEREIHNLAGEPFNIGSPKQLQEVLFEKLKLPPGRRTKTGLSTDARVLERLAGQHEIARKILEYRELTKLRSTFVEGLLLALDAGSGRIHTSLNQTGTATGRLSSSEPNLQNIPIRTELGREIRRAFIAPPGTHLLLCADYSQIELRILAHVSGDLRLREAFASDHDVHARTAAEVYGVALDAVTPEMRRQAKMVNFGIAYGMSAYGLAERLQIPDGAAQDLINRYFETFPGVYEYVESTIATARSQGFVTTLMGRRRYIPDIRSPNRQAREFAERTAVNMPIQGLAADIIKVAMVRVHRQLKERGLASRMVMQVHDELVFEMPTAEEAALTGLVKECMSGAVALSVPVKVDVEVGPNWRDLRKPEGSETTTLEEASGPL